MQSKIKIYHTKNKKNMGVLLGRDRERDKLVFARHSNTNTPPNSLIIGSAGTGKTHFYTKNQIKISAMQEHSMVFLGRKEDLNEKVMFLGENNYQIIEHEATDVNSLIENINDLVSHLTERKTVLFLYKSFKTNENYCNELLVSFYNALFDSLTKAISGQDEKEPLTHLSMFFEDFYSINEIINIVDFFQTSHKKGISMHISIQSVSQMQGLSQTGNPWAEILEACPIKIYFGANDIETIDFFHYFANNQLPKQDIFYLSAEDMLVNIENNRTLHLQKHILNT